MEVNKETQIYIPIKDYQAIHTSHWEVECFTDILTLPSNKTIRTLSFCDITHIIVTQKDV